MLSCTGKLGSPVQGIPQGPKNASALPSEPLFVPRSGEYGQFAYCRLHGRHPHSSVGVVTKHGWAQDVRAGLFASEQRCCGLRKKQDCSRPEALGDWDDRELDAADYLLDVRSTSAMHGLSYGESFERSVKGKGSLDCAAARALAFGRLTQLSRPRGLSPSAGGNTRGHHWSLGFGRSNLPRPFPRLDHQSRRASRHSSMIREKYIVLPCCLYYRPLVDRPDITSASYVPYLRSLCRKRNEPIVILRLLAASLLLKGQNAGRSWTGQGRES